MERDLSAVRMFGRDGQTIPKGVTVESENGRVVRYICRSSMAECSQIVSPGKPLPASNAPLRDRLSRPRLLPCQVSAESLNKKFVWFPHSMFILSALPSAEDLDTDVALHHMYPPVHLTFIELARGAIATRDLCSPPFGWTRESYSFTSVYGWIWSFYAILGREDKIPSSICICWDGVGLEEGSADVTVTTRRRVSRGDVQWASCIDLFTVSFPRKESDEGVVAPAAGLLEAMRMVGSPSLPIRAFMETVVMVVLESLGL